MSDSQVVAKALLDIKAVGFKPENPITFKSGIISPVYVDNRTLPFHPEKWKIILEGFKNLILEHSIEFDAIAGIESAGIPHSAGLGLLLEKPSVFVRKATKDHGTKKMVEGGNVSEKKVLLLEDHVSTGSSSLKGVDSLREEKAVVNNCLAITSYEFSEAKENFADKKVRLFTLTTFSEILELALEEKVFSAQQKQVIEDWFTDPHGWGKRHGHE